MKTKIGIVITACLIAMVAQTVVVDAQNETFTYSGTITWRAGKISGKSASHDMAGKPVVGAKIRMGPGNFTATTDANGRFVVKGIPRGSYTLHVKAKERSSMTRWVVVNENEVANDMTLLWRNFRIGK